ncbi:MAG: helix-turn-helix domain-containing protein [Bifidobacteriaceae bacterium]|jgi:DNA-binding transcriptional regulator LsrR (DeoR family)|nr:helix-turn-helix domain-containing protein [Bifidobacteriaceae bacterium]
MDELDAGEPSPSERARAADAADLYYLQGLKVEETADRLGLSRSTVSRLLAKARRYGIVEFVLHRTADEASTLSGRLHAQFGVRAIVAAIPPDAPRAERMDAVGERAASHLATLVAPDTTVAVAWSPHIEALTRHLPTLPTPGTRVVQLHGSGTGFVSGVHDAGKVLDRVALAFGATAHPLPIPAFFDSPATRDAVWAERSVRRILRLRRAAHVAIVSVGVLDTEEPGHLYRAGFLDGNDLADLGRDGAMGDIGTVFVRADGTSDGIAVNARSTGLPIAELCAIPTRVLIAGGSRTAPTVRAALRAGVATDIVLDDAAARALLSD